MGRFGASMGQACLVAIYIYIYISLSLCSSLFKMLMKKMPGCLWIAAMGTKQFVRPLTCKTVQSQGRVAMRHVPSTERSHTNQGWKCQWAVLAFVATLLFPRNKYPNLMLKFVTALRWDTFCIFLLMLGCFLLGQVLGSGRQTRST